MNVTELIAAVEERYWCMLGPQTACFDISACNEASHGVRLTYVELKAKMAGRLAQNESFLCDWMANVIGLPADAGRWNRGQSLFWRLSSKIEVAEDEFTLANVNFYADLKGVAATDADAVFAAACARGFDYRPEDLGWRSKIYARLVIPGRDLSEWGSAKGCEMRRLVKP